MLIIINADDLGLTHESNMGIKQAFEHGMVTQTTFVSNSPFSEEDARIAHDLGIVDRVGLHLNLCECPTLTEPIRSFAKYMSAEDPTLFDFNPTYMEKETYGESPFVTYAQSYLSEEFAAEVEALREEVAAQIDAFRGYGFTCNHIDAHRNTIVDLPIWLAAAPVIEEAGFSTIRPVFDSFTRPDDIMNNAYLTWMAVEHAFSGLRSVGYTSSVMRFAKRRAQLLEDDPDQTIEIYVHPILEGGELLDNFSGGCLLEDNIATLEGFERASYYEL